MKLHFLQRFAAYLGCLLLALTFLGKVQVATSASLLQRDNAPDQTRNEESNVNYGALTDPSIQQIQQAQQFLQTSVQGNTLNMTEETKENIYASSEDDEHEYKGNTPPGNNQTQQLFNQFLDQYQKQQQQLNTLVAQIAQQVPTETLREFDTNFEEWLNETLGEEENESVKAPLRQALKESYTQFLRLQRHQFAQFLLSQFFQEQASQQSLKLPQDQQTQQLQEWLKAKNLADEFEQWLGNQYAEWKTQQEKLYPFESWIAPLPVKVRNTFQGYIAKVREQFMSYVDEYGFMDGDDEENNRWQQQWENPSYSLKLIAWAIQLAKGPSEEKKNIDENMLYNLLTIIKLPNQQPLQNDQTTKEKILFELLYDGLNNNVNQNEFDAELPNDTAKAYAQAIFDIGAHYINKEPQSHKDKLLYYFFRPYEMTSINQGIDPLATQYEADLQQIARRIRYKQIRKAFVALLEDQHSLFMHGLITPWLWENGPIRRYFPSSVWYFCSMLGAKLCQLYPWAHNYQGLYVLLGFTPNSYTQVIEAQRKVINDILYPTPYTIYHILYDVLMYTTAICIISAFMRLIKQHGHFTPPSDVDRKDIKPRIKGDFRSLFIEQLHGVPWLHDYALADYTGTINDIGKLFVLLLFFSSFDCLIPTSEVKENKLFW